MDAHPRRAGRQEAQLLRLLLRDVPRRDLLEPLPRQLPGVRARRAGRRRTATSTPRRPICASRRRASSARSAASSRPARSDQVFCKFGGGDPWAAYDALVEQANTLPIPAPGFTRRPAPGQRRRHPQRHAHHALQQGQLVAPWPTRSPRRPPGDADSALPGRCRLGEQLRRHVRPGHRPLLHDRRDRADATPRTCSSYLDAGWYFYCDHVGGWKSVPGQRAVEVVAQAASARKRKTSTFFFSASLCSPLFSR